MFLHPLLMVVFSVNWYPSSIVPFFLGRYNPFISEFHKLQSNIKSWNFSNLKKLI